jgi:hypothetical protein
MGFLFEESHDCAEYYQHSGLFRLFAAHFRIILFDRNIQVEKMPSCCELPDTFGTDAALALVDGAANIQFTQILTGVAGVEA